jgi:hypothetical protein
MPSCEPGGECRQAARACRAAELTAEFVYPIQQLSTIFARAYEHAVFDAGCEDHTAMYTMKRISPPTQPYVVAFNLGSREFVKRVAADPFCYILPPDKYLDNSCILRAQARRYWQHRTWQSGTISQRWQGAGRGGRDRDLSANLAPIPNGT